MRTIFVYSSGLKFQGIDGNDCVARTSSFGSVAKSTDTRTAACGSDGAVFLFLFFSFYITYVF